MPLSARAHKIPAAPLALKPQLGIGKDRKNSCYLQRLPPFFFFVLVRYGRAASRQGCGMTAAFLYVSVITPQTYVIQVCVRIAENVTFATANQ